MKNIVLGLLTAIAIGSSLTQAQWLKYPTPGIPRLPDGTANLNAPAPRSASGKPDLSGLWRGTRNLINDISAATQPGELVMLPTAQALLKERIANSQRDDPSAGCIPGGVPRTTFVGSSYPFRTVSTPDRLVILYEAIHTWRGIFADGRALPADMNPTWMGYLVGRWDGDEFVVSTAGFNNRGWLDNLGHPATERLRVTERFIRRDFGHMDVRMTVDDPGAYAKPFTVTLPLLFQADQDLLEYVCNENNRYFQILPRNPIPARRSPSAFRGRLTPYRRARHRCRIGGGSHAGRHPRTQVAFLHEEESGGRNAQSETRLAAHPWSSVQWRRRACAEGALGARHRGFRGRLDPRLTKSGATDPERRVITHGPEWMRVEIHRPGDVRPPVLIYKLDGSPNVNPFGSGTATTEIRRDRNDIVTVTVFTMSDRPVTVQERLQITAAGDMTAAVLVRVEHGYQGCCLRWRSKLQTSQKHRTTFARLPECSGIRLWPRRSEQDGFRRHLAFYTTAVPVREPAWEALRQCLLTHAFRTPP